jgi:hypothetical protein
MVDIRELSLKRFLVVGLVRNCSQDIELNLSRLSKALQSFSSIHWLLIESDSDDNSLEHLEIAAKKFSNFRYLSAGVLVDKMPLRTERLAYCRNMYLQEIKHNPIYSNIDYVVVSDFDNTNTLLTEEAILSCWERDDWDVCTANQRGPYYDIWALRHPIWSPGDCWLEHRFLSQFSKSSDALAYSCIYSKMIELPITLEWVQVDSSFGGLGVYKKSAMCASSYIGLYDNGLEVCEHVPFHLKIRASGGRIFINPRLINIDYTEHSLHLKG